MGSRKQTALERYCKGVLSGKIVACDKIRKVCDRLLADIGRKTGPWVFSPEKAERPVRFIETFCKVPSGRLGKPLELELYEKAVIEATFGFVSRETGMRKYNEVFLCMARKNGKTSLAAALQLYMLVADGEGSPQIYNAANNLDQAQLGYKAAIKMVRQSGDLARHVRKQADQLYCDLNMGFIKPMASNVLTLDGLDVHMAVIDEIHAMRTREIYDLMKQGTAARDQPLIFQVTTNGFVRNSIFDSTYEQAARWCDGNSDNERFLPFVYELDDRDEWLDETCWAKANPGLGTIKSISYLRENVAKAKEDPSYLPTVMTKDFNVPENSSAAWLTFEEAVNEETFDLKSMGFRYGIVGFDASDSVDLTAARMLLMRPGDDKIYEIGMYWIPEDVLNAEIDSGRQRDRDYAPYRLWVARGLMRAVPGNKIPKSVLIDWINEVATELDVFTFAVSFDPWHMDDTVRQNLESLVGKGRSVALRQGALTLSQPMKQLKADFRANRIVDNHNPVNEWCRMNVSVRSDINCNIQPDKRLNDPRNRIDGFMAELDAYICLMNMMEDYQQIC